MTLTYYFRFKKDDFRLLGGISVIIISVKQQTPLQEVRTNKKFTNGHSRHYQCFVLMSPYAFTASVCFIPRCSPNFLRLAPATLFRCLPKGYYCFFASMHQDPKVPRLGLDMAFSSMGLLFPFVIRTPVILDYDPGHYLNLVTSSKTLFPNKVTFPGTRSIISAKTLFPNKVIFPSTRS